jgi:hypothetical protein
MLLVLGGIVCVVLIVLVPWLFREAEQAAEWREMQAANQREADKRRKALGVGPEVNPFAPEYRSRLRKLGFEVDDEPF